MSYNNAQRGRLPYFTQQSWTPIDIPLQQLSLIQT